MGRKPILSRQKVLCAALQIVDQQSLDALSMRRLAAALDVEAMSLYRHVANKSALLDAVHEAVLGQMRLPRRTGQWIDDSRRLARAFRKTLCAHPNALPLFATRPAVTVGSLEVVELALAVLSEPFPEARTRVRALQTLVTFVVGNTMSHFCPPDAMADYRTLPAEDFPMLAAVGASLTSYSADREFEFGLDALLVGLQAKSKASR